MFSGLVEEIGRIVVCDHKPGKLVLSIDGPKVTQDAGIGDSIAVNGVCLTVVALEGTVFLVEAIPETLDRTNLGHLKINTKVNVERSLSVNGRFGGHVVQGHIDGVCEIVRLEPEGESLKIWFSISEGLKKYVISKGYVAIDGMSLTVVDVIPASNLFSICLIPHTKNVTIAGYYHVGTVVNFEADILTKTTVAVCENYLKEKGL